jgi:hypothetical protein
MILNNNIPSGRLLEIISNINNITVSNVTVLKNTGCFAYLWPYDTESSVTLAMYLSNSTFTNNFGGADSLFNVNEKSYLNISGNTSFIENYGTFTASVISAFS